MKKSEPIRIQLREIHTANARMRRRKGACEMSLFAQYVNKVCPAWHIYEGYKEGGKLEDLYSRYELARRINAISPEDCKPGPYDRDYAEYCASCFPPFPPDAWKIFEGGN